MSGPAAELSVDRLEAATTGSVRVAAAPKRAARWMWLVPAVAAVVCVLPLLAIALRGDGIELAEPPESWSLIEQTSEPFPELEALAAQYSEVIGDVNVDAELREWQSPDGVALLGVLRHAVSSSEVATWFVSEFSDGIDAASACEVAEHPHVHAQCSSKNGWPSATVMWQRHNTLITVEVVGRIGDPAAVQFIDDQLLLAAPTEAGAPREFSYRFLRIARWFALFAGVLVTLAITMWQRSRRGPLSEDSPPVASDALPT